MDKIVIIDYGLGNLSSVANMVNHVGGSCMVTSSVDDISNATKLILPGVGAFDKGMEQLNTSGIREALDEAVLQRKIPILGICLGMQLMAKSSEEGQLPGLGWLDADVKKFSFSDGMNLKIPHMGWNLISIRKETPLFTYGDEQEQRFYFVHSYYVKANRQEDVLCETKYGAVFCSAFARENIMGVQFHPEKSHKFGMSLMKKYIQI